MALAVARYSADLTPKTSGFSFLIPVGVKAETITTEATATIGEERSTRAIHNMPQAYTPTIAMSVRTMAATIPTSVATAVPSDR